MQSLLARQLLLARDAFVARYPHPWLIWEPGPTSVPRSGVDVAVADTKLPTGNEAPSPTPRHGDAVCFALKAPVGALIRIGRATDNELVISDLTVSRLHARLEHTEAGWSLVPLSETKVTKVQGAEASLGLPVPLTPGCIIELGGVRLIFDGAQGFKDRLAAGVHP